MVEAAETVVMVPTEDEVAWVAAGRFRAAVALSEEMVLTVALEVGMAAKRIRAARKCGN
jgi:hypothetical protein